MKRKTLQNQLPKRYLNKDPEVREQFYLSLQRTLKKFSWVHWYDRTCVLRLCAKLTKEKGLLEEILREQEELRNDVNTKRNKNKSSSDIRR